MALKPVDLIFGGGVERASGVLAAPPNKMRDLRNVHTQLNKIEARGGTEAVAIFDDEYGEIDAILASRALKDQQASIHIAYSSIDRNLGVYLAALSGSTPLFVDDWEVVDPGATLPPRIISGASYGKAFFAHDEELPNFRAQTIYYDSFATPNLVRLEADLGAEYGTGPVRFRGVVRHLAYMMGWGFNNEDDDRPEFLRISKPGEPHIFHKDWYFIVGQRGDPIISAAPLGGKLTLFKSSESYVLSGYDRETFGVVRLDSAFGIAGSRLAIHIDGFGLMFWSLEGPRITTGGPSEDLSLPLDIGGPDPEALVASGEVEDGVVGYVPKKKEVWFVFGRRVYALSLRIPGQLEWSYHELPWEIASIGTLFIGGRSDVAPTGYPEFVSADPSTTSASVQVANINAAGDEINEVWLREEYGEWSLEASIPVSGSSQLINFSGLTEDTAYECAFRYRRGVLYTAGYEANDPDSWPSVSIGAFMTDEGDTPTEGLNPPTNLAADWSRTSDVAEQFDFSWTNAHGDKDLEYRIDGGDWESLSAGTESLVEAIVTGEVEGLFEIRHVDGEETSDIASIETWAGPAAIPTFTAFSATRWHAEFSWTNGDASLATRLEAVDEDEQTDVGEASAGDTFAIVIFSVAPKVLGSIVEGRIRHRALTFSVFDFGPWTPSRIAIVSA